MNITIRRNLSKFDDVAFFIEYPQYLRTTNWLFMGEERWLLGIMDDFGNFVR